MKRIAPYFSFLLLFSFSAVFSQNAAGTLQYIYPGEKKASMLGDWKEHVGDSLNWKNVDYDDAHWKRYPGYGLWKNTEQSGKGIRWYRKRIFLPKSIEESKILALYISVVVSAAEIYWDGQRVGRNGRVDNIPRFEVPGVSRWIVPVDNDLTTPGEHVLAIRMSNHHLFSGLIDSPIIIGYYSSIHDYLFKHGAVLTLLAGIFLFTAIFHLAILFGYRDKWTYAIFSAFGLACAGHILFQSIFKFFSISVSWYYVFAALNDIPWFFMMSLLPSFFIFEFKFHKKEVVAIIIAVVAFLTILLPRLVFANILPVSLLNGFVALNRAHSYVTILFSAFVALWALAQRKIGCLTSAAGLISFIAGVLLTNRYNLDYGWGLGFAVMILFLTASLSNQMAQRNREYQDAQLRAARLELDLLRKHIQPHFLLNSLNSIIAWLEEDPGTAAKLVNALADELRILLNFSRHRLVTLNEEVRLCKAHLQVMSLRYDKHYALEKENVVGDEQIPPLVIHTLIENGLTHGYTGKNRGTFVLRREECAEGLKLVIFNDGNSDNTISSAEEGTGLKYVRSRLEEMFPGKWTLEYGPVSGGWEVTLKIVKG